MAYNWRRSQVLYKRTSIAVINPDIIADLSTPMSTSHLLTKQAWDEQSLAARRKELTTTIDMVVNFLAPDLDRRTGEARRSGRERRDARSDALYADRRSGRDRRESSDRRM